MAPPPKNTQVNREDLPDAPRWVDKLLEVLNPFIRSVAAALTRGLTLQENMRAQVKTLTLTTGGSVSDSFPLRFKCELEAPYACVLVQCLPLEGNHSSSGGAAVNSWKLTPTGEVEISYIGGLMYETKYRLTFILL